MGKNEEITFLMKFAVKNINEVINGNITQYHVDLLVEQFEAHVKFQNGLCNNGEICKIIEGTEIF